MPILIISRFEERITQSDLLNALHIRIIDEIRIDIKEHWHVNCLPSIQSLLLETETLDLAEIWRHLRRRNAICRHPNDIVFSLVCSCVERQCRLSR